MSEDHSIFDPIGLTYPVSVFPKQLLQKLWSMKLKSKGEIDLVSQFELLKWRKNISHLENVRILRCFRSGNI